MTTINWAALQKESQGQLSPVPDGDYNLKCVDASATVASTGAPMIKAKFEIVDGPHVKRKLLTNLVVSTDNPMALAIFFRNMTNLGLNSDYFVSNPSMDQVANELIGRLCRGTVGSKVYQGVDRNEIKAILPPVGGGPMAPGTVTGVATPGGPIAPTASPKAAPTGPPNPETSVKAAQSTNATDPPALPF